MQGGSSPSVIVVSLLNTCLGAGIVSSAAAFKSQGLLLGFLTNIFYLVLSYYSFIWLIEAGLHRRKLSFQSLCQDVFPTKKWASRGLNMTILLFAWFCILSYSVLISTSVPNLLAWIFGPQVHSYFWGSSEFALFAISLTVLLPLGCCKTVGALSYASSCAIFVVLYLALFGITAFFKTILSDFSVISPNVDPQGVVLFRFSTFFVGLGLYGFAYGAHFSCFGLWKSLKDKSVKLFRKVILVGFLVIGITITIIGVCFYFVIGDAVRGNFLEALDEASVWVFIGNFLIFVLVTVSYPVLLLFVRDSIADQFFKPVYTSHPKIIEATNPIDSVPEIIQTSRVRAISRTSSVSSFQEFDEEFSLSESDRLTDSTDDFDGPRLSDVEVELHDSKPDTIVDIDDDILIKPIPDAAEDQADVAIDVADAFGLNKEEENGEVKNIEVTGSDKLNTRQRISISISIVASTLLIGLLIPDVLIVFGISGSLLASIIVFVFPAAVRLCCGLPVSRRLRTLCIMSLVTGITTALVGTVQAIMDL
ncbi:hypothetical protein P9112_008940 [Eukaryota sp. TZLM1-RC]